MAGEGDRGDPQEGEFVGGSVLDVGMCSREQGFVGDVCVGEGVCVYVGAVGIDDLVYFFLIS